MNLLAIDPGETVGWSIWDTDAYECLAGGQTPRTEFADRLAAALGIAKYSNGPDEDYGPFVDEDGDLIFIDQIVMEDWSIYPQEARSGALDWDKCLTARTIGAVQQLARMAGVPVSFQAAMIKPAAIAMGAENHFVSPLHENRHQNDSRMHAIHFIVKTVLSAK